MEKTTLQQKIIAVVATAVVALIAMIFLAAFVIHFIHANERASAKRPEVAVTIPEGSTIYDIDRILGTAAVIQPGALIAAAQASSSATRTSSLEGMLFPDTYDFYVTSTPAMVIQKMTDNFNAKAEPLLATAGANASSDLIIASILEKEVATSTDWAIVAGILEKRLADGIPLDVDASICYIKEQQAEAQKNASSRATTSNSAASATVTSTSTGAVPAPAPCVLTAADLKINSPYNTYLYRGLPPAPIDNPGLATISAAIHPASSTYFYYLTDPRTGKTIYAVTLAQQEANQKKYLQ